MSENLGDLIAAQQFKATKKYAQENLSHLSGAELKQLLDFWLDLGEINDAKIFYQKYLEESLKYRHFFEQESLVPLLSKLNVNLSLQFELLILLEDWNALMDLYEKNYDNLFLKKRMRTEWVEPMIRLMKKYKDLYTDFRFQIFCLEMELLEDILLMDKTGLQVTLEGKKELLARLTIAATMYPWLYCSICLLLNRISAQTQLLEFLKEKNILRQIKNRIHKNRMLNDLVQTYLLQPQQEEQKGINEQKIYKVDYSFIRSTEPKELLNRQGAELDESDKALAALSFADAMKALNGELLLNYLTTRWQLGADVEVLNFIQKNINQFSEKDLIGILYLEGEIYESMGLEKEAQKNYKKVFLLDANYKKVRLKIDVT